MGFGNPAVDLQTIATLNGHNGSVDCVRFTQKDDLVFSADDIGIIKQWDMNTDSQTTYNGHMKSVKTLDFHPLHPLFVSGSNDTTIRLWDMTRGHEALSKYRAHIANVNHVQFSPDGNWVASAGAEGTVLIWDLRMGAHIKEFPDSTSAVSCIQFHPSELLLAAGRTNGTVDIFDLDANKSLRRITLSTGTVKSCLFNEQGDWLFVGTDSGMTVVQWEADREVDFIESTWCSLSSMKLVNNKLICGTLDGPQAQVHSINVELIGRMMPVPQQRMYGASATPGAVMSQKAFLYSQQKELGKSRLRLLGGAGGPQPASLPQNLHHLSQGTTDDDSGSPSSNLSIEMAEDETLTPARVNQLLDDDSDTLEFAYPTTDLTFSLGQSHDSWQDTPFNDRHNSLSLASSSSPSYDDPETMNKSLLSHERGDLLDQSRKNKNRDEYVDSSPLFNSGNSDLGYRSDSGGDCLRDQSTVDDYPVNNAPPPNYAPKSRGSVNATARIGRQKTSMGFTTGAKATQVVRPTVATGTGNGRLAQSKRLTSSVSDLTDSANGKAQNGVANGGRSSRRVAKSPFSTRVTERNDYNANTVNKENKNAGKGKDIKVEFFGKPPTRSKSSFDMRSAGLDRNERPIGGGGGNVARIPVHTSRVSRPTLYENSSNYNYRNGGGGGLGGAGVEEEFNHLINDHHRVYHEFRNRHTTLEVNKIMVMQDIVRAIGTIGRKDTAVLVDILGAVLEKPSGMSLDIATAVLPELYQLLQSDRKFHWTRACDAMRVILSGFLGMIKENTAYAAHSIGVDVQSEERYRKCHECRHWLKQIKNIPDNGHLSNGLSQIQSLIGDL